MARIIAICLLITLFPALRGFMDRAYEKKSGNKNNFICKAPGELLKVLYICAFLIFVLLSLVGILSASGLIKTSPDNEPWMFVFMGIFFMTAILFPGFVYTIWRVRVDGEKVFYSSCLGFRKRFEASDIRRAVVQDDGNGRQGLILYGTNGRVLARISSDFTNLDKMNSWLKRHDIAIEEAFEQGVTAFTLFFCVMRPIALFFFCFWAVIAVFFTLVFIMNLEKNGGDVFDLVKTHVFFFVFWHVLIIGIISPIPLRGVLHIFRQEKVLQFSFKQEMKRLNVCGPRFKNPDWYIKLCRFSRILAYRRDFFVQDYDKDAVLAKADRKRGRMGLTQIRLNAVDGKRIKIVADYNDIKAFMNWLSQSVRP